PQRDRPGGARPSGAGGSLAASPIPGGGGGPPGPGAPDPPGGSGPRGARTGTPPPAPPARGNDGQGRPGQDRGAPDRAAGQASPASDGPGPAPPGTPAGRAALGGHPHPAGRKPADHASGVVGPGALVLAKRGRRAPGGGAGPGA